MSIKHILLFVLLFISNEIVFGQNKKIDSLRNVLSHVQADTNKVKTLNSLAWEIKNTNLDSATVLCNEAIRLSEQLKWTKGLTVSENYLGWFYYTANDIVSALDHDHKAIAYCEKLISSGDELLIKTGKRNKAKTMVNMAIMFWQQGDYPKALEHYLKSLKISEEADDKMMIGRTIANMGMIYNEQADYPKALEYYLKGLKISEEVGDISQVGRALSNIGSLYRSQNEYDKSIEYYLKSIKISEEAGDKQMVGRTYGNIGSIYQEKSDFAKAMEYHLKALKISEEVEDALHVGRMLSAIAGSYTYLKDYAKANDYYLRGIKISEEVGDKYQVAKTLTSLGIVNTFIGNYTLAEGFLKRSGPICKEMGAKDLECDNEVSFSKLYEKADRFELAFEHYKKYIGLRDSIFNEENSKKLVRTEMKHDFEKKEAVMIEQQDKERAVAAEKNRFQQIVIATVVFGLLLVIVFSFFVFRTLKTTRKQKLVIEEKQNEILDSIHYAKRIQRALITNEKYIEKSLNKLNKNA